MATTLITAATAAATKRFVLTLEDVPATITATGLAAGESIALDISIDSGANFITAYQGGTAVTLTSTDNVKSINAPGVFRANKGITAGAVGVYLAKGTKTDTL